MPRPPPVVLPLAPRAPGRRDFAYEAVKADRLRRDRRVALVDDCLAVDQGEGEQGRHGLVEAVPGEHRGERLIELLSRFGEQE
jgi:hypothetical protein